MAKSLTQTPPNQQANLPGAYFDVPGLPGGATQWTEQDESTTNVATVAQSTQQVQIQGILPFLQTDVVADWSMYLSIAQTYTPGSSTLTASAYAPMNYVGPTKLLIQNQYASVDVESGIDLYIFDLMRPRSVNQAVSGNNLGFNPAGDPIGGTATGYPTTAIAQANQYNAAQWATTSTVYNLQFRLPAAQWFDVYYDLAVTGEPVSAPHAALVSPQYMASTTRVITPLVMINAGNVATTDSGPVNIGAGSGTFVGSNVVRFRRRAVYAASNVASMPPVYAWQYRRKTTRFGIGGQSQITILVPLDTGQLLGAYVRLFDPSAAGGLGAPININTVTRFSLQYGSGLFWFDAQTLGGTTASELTQMRWFETRPSMLPPGVLALDLATDELGRTTNKRALNTLTTSGILFKITFTAALSATAYAVLGTESLVYVT